VPNGGTATTERKSRAHAALPQETAREHPAPGCASLQPPAVSRSWKKADPAPAEHEILALKTRQRRMKMTKIKTRLGQMAVATMLATGLLVVAQIDSADATVSGKNGVIAFESNRTMGKGVHNPTGDTETFTAEPDGSGLEQLTHNKAEDFSPAFSPNGRQTAFVSERDGDFEVYKMRADGSVARTFTQKPSNSDQNPSWQAR
jgi:hypothetical protein